jgi:hypothetical protein
MKTSQQIAEGISHHQWFGYYECIECKKIQSYKINKPAVVETEYSVSSMKSTPIGINAKNWPTHEN